MNHFQTVIKLIALGLLTLPVCGFLFGSDRESFEQLNGRRVALEDVVFENDRIPVNLHVADEIIEGELAHIGEGPFQGYYDLVLGDSAYKVKFMRPRYATTIVSRDDFDDPYFSDKYVVTVYDVTQSVYLHALSVFDENGFKIITHGKYPSWLEKYDDIKILGFDVDLWVGDGWEQFLYGRGYERGSEPHQVFRRPFGLSYAAMAGASSMA